MRAISLLLLVGLLPLLAAATPPGAAASADPAVCVAVDGSGSNQATSGPFPPSDPGPLSLRAEAVALLAALLPADAPGSDPRLAAVVFGSDAVVVPAAAVASNTERVAFDQRVRALVQSNLGWTRLTDGLARCADLLEQASPARRRLLVVLSDFVAEDDAQHLDFATQRTLLQTQLLPRLERAHITLSALGYGQAVRDPQGQFQQLMRALASPTGGTAEVVAPDEPSLLLAVGRLLAQFAHADLQPSPAQVARPDAAAVFPLEVAPSTTQLVVVVEHPSDPATRVTLVDPRGARHAAPPDATDGTWEREPSFQRIVVLAPLPGLWTLEVRGTGLVRVDRWMSAAAAAAGPPAATLQPRPTVVASATLRAPSPTPSGTATSSATTAPGLIATRGPSDTPTAAVATRIAGGATPSATRGPVGTPPTGWAIEQLLLLILASLALVGGLPLAVARWWPTPADTLGGELTVETPDGAVCEVPLEGKSRLLVGVGPDCDLVLADAAVADLQLELSPARSARGRPVARARALVPPVACAGDPLPSAGRVLEDGDELQLGGSRLLYRNLGA